MLKRYPDGAVDTDDIMRQRAAHNRRHQGPCEEKVGDTLNALGMVFDRQRIFGRYIVDFYLPGLGLAIEVDGRHHYQPDKRKADEERTRTLRKMHGVAVVRIPNARTVMPGFKEYLRALLAAPPIRRRPPSPTPQASAPTSSADAGVRRGDGLRSPRESQQTGNLAPNPCASETRQGPASEVDATPHSPPGRKTDGALPRSA